MSKLADVLLKTKRPIVIVSPHLDDAILSCGSLLLELQDKLPVTVINVCTKAHGGPYTLSARQFLKTSGNTDAVKLFVKREQEDRRALSQVGVKVHNFHFQDALFRRKAEPGLLKFIPEFSHLYPTYRWHIVGTPHPQDPLAEKLTEKLKQVLPKNALLLAPFNIAGHVDHQIVREVSQKICEHTILYAEFPYTTRKNDYGFAPTHRRLELAVDPKSKEQLIMQYQTQVSGLFPSGTIDHHKEVYFVPPTL